MEEEQYESLKLNQQICFPIYAASRIITKYYQPLLNKIDLTYPQYLVMLLMWEHEVLNVKSIGEKLILASNTLTPLLKRLQEKSLIERKRSDNDERVVEIILTNEGKALKNKAKDVPKALVASFKNEKINLEDIKQLKMILELIIQDYKAV